MNGTLVPVLIEFSTTAQVSSTMCVVYNTGANFDNTYSSSQKAHWIISVNRCDNRWNCPVLHSEACFLHLYIFSVPELTDPPPLWLPTREERQTSKSDDFFTATPIVPNQQEIVNETPEDMSFRVTHSCFRRTRLD